MKTKIKARKIRGWKIEHVRIDGPSKYYVLPADTESIERMAFQVAAAFLESEHGGFNWTPNGFGIGHGKAALRALGITATHKP